MRIYDRDLTGAAAAESGRSQETQRTDREATSAPSGAAGGSGDRVELSSGFASVARAISSLQAGRAGMVQSLTMQFQSGNYQPDSLATSQGIIAEAMSGGVG